ncbi:MAG: hypothetical protein APR54_05295 [Candidatus Cloacimonas sp. SDB]|nr:MAG: hypothetical protein APR54_05295 [Candidatus Cloacimonas sp. SDB]
MKQDFDPESNYEQSKNRIGYVPLHKATRKIYSDLGFKCGLEVHQQLKTRKKLFCHCPAGIYQKKNCYDAELIRHMRPTLSEMGTYDGTALMEFKTRKNITYRIENQTACTYDVDDTPPFKVNREALNYALEIALMLKTNIVGELHITRKQYLDGSIPTGFQRTAIIGIEGEIPLRHKKVRIIQISLEEDSCREISDIGHERIYSTDRLGIPLIETVTYPDLLTPFEAEEAGHYIRFLNRSSGRVRVGSGAGREDVNVSINGGTRVEIKGVSHIKWIPELTHNEAFRQKSLLTIKADLLKLYPDPAKWKPVFKEINFDVQDIQYPPIKDAVEKGKKIIAVNLPDFKGILSFFTQPGKTFADELCDRLKVIACLEKPNMLHSEDLKPVFDKQMLKRRSKLLGSGENDAQLVFWANDYDLQTAKETIEERCRMAFEGVPNETRKSLAAGTTIFERVLPGADRMYPDTDSAPIPIKDEAIKKISEELPVDLKIRINQLKDWQVPEDTHHYLLRNNLVPLIEKIHQDLDFQPRFVATLLAHRLKHIEGKIEHIEEFDYQKIYDLMSFCKKKKLEQNILPDMLPILYENSNIEFESILRLIKYQKYSKKKIISEIDTLKKVFRNLRTRDSFQAELKWIMGNLREIALGNINMNELSQVITQNLNNSAKD